MIYQAGGVAERGPVILADNKLAGGIVASATAAALGHAANLLTETTYDVWQSSLLTANVVITPPAPVTFDTMALVGHNLGGTGAQLLFGYRATIGGATIYASPNIIPADAGPIINLSAPALAAQLLFTVHTGSTVQPLISCFWAGSRIAPPVWVGPDYIRAPDAVMVEGEAAISRGGQYLGATMRRLGGRLSVPLSPLPVAFADQPAWVGFRGRYNARRPFFFGSSPFHHPNDVAYGWRAEGARELGGGLLGGGQDLRLNLEIDFHVS